MTPEVSHALLVLEEVIASEQQAPLLTLLASVDRHLEEIAALIRKDMTAPISRYDLSRLAARLGEAARRAREAMLK